MSSSVQLTHRRLIYSVEVCGNYAHTQQMKRRSHAHTHTDLVDRSESPGTQNLDTLQLRLFQDPQLSLVGGRAARGQGLHQLPTQQTKHVKASSGPGSSNTNAKSFPGRRENAATAVTPSDQQT